MVKKVVHFKKLIVGATLLSSLLASFAVYAQATDISGLASNIQATFIPIINLVVALCYLAGVGFTAAAIFKFKAHKDNPTQIPIGTPIMMLFVGIALLFLPEIVKDVMNSAGFTSGGSGFNYSGGNITGGGGS